MRWCYYLISLFIIGSQLGSRAKGVLLPSGINLLPFDTTSILSPLLEKTQAAQDSLASLQQLPTRFINRASSKTELLNRRLSKRTAKALRRMKSQEKKIHSKLAKIDSVAAKSLFIHSIDSLGNLQNLIKGKITQATSKIPGGQYLARLDTLQNALGFLSKYQSQLKQFDGAEAKIQNSLNSVRQLEGRLDQVQNVQQYINERKQLLTRALSQYGDVFNKNLGAISKEAYYYQAQIATYKELWQHPDQLEAKAVSLLNKIPAFQAFYKKHSQLASLFNLSSDYGNAASLAGLQTRAMVEQELQRRLQSAGPDGRKQIQQQLQQATQRLKELKNKFPGLNSTAQMPDFQPKDIKSKPFLNRLEYGANVSFERATSYFPTTSDLAAQVAYEFSEKGSAGLGMAFKLAWGKDIRKIHFTAQGLGLRSFLDYRIVGTFYTNGGFEFQFNKTISNIPTLKDLNGWAKSALLGIERKYKVGSKLNGNVMLLFDFLYKEHVPQTQPLIFRVGYKF